MTRASNKHITGLHPGVYRAAIALTALYVLAVWYGFAGHAYTDYLLVVVTVFLAFCVGLVETVGRIHKRGGSSRRARPGRFEHWARSYVDVAEKPIKGYTAAVEMLLPLAAVAFGMVGFALLAHIVG